MLLAKILNWGGGNIGFAEQEIICTSGMWRFNENVFDVS
jgi:hypothetical protein